MEVLGLDEDVRVEQVAGQAENPHFLSDVIERLRLRDTEHAKGVAVEGLAFERAFDEGSRKAAANPRQGRAIEIAAATASFGDRSQPGSLRGPCGVEGGPGQPPASRRRLKMTRLLTL
jgi:hypothetical protein